MFLPNSHSFVLAKSVKPVFRFASKMFLPNSYSFLLVSSVIFKPDTQSGIPEFPAEVPKFQSRPRNVGTSGPVPASTAVGSVSPAYLRRGRPAQPASTAVEQGGQGFNAAIGTSEPSSPNSAQPAVINKDKRTFLKAAGIAGAGLVGSLLIPEKADALIMGSSPTTGVVGVKNSANARINPATEETLDEVLKTSNLIFDAGGALHVKVTDAVSVALPPAASTEDTLETIAWGSVKLALRLETVGSVDYIAEAPVGTAIGTALWRVKKVDSSSGIIITWADGDAEFNNVATNLPGLTYS